METHQYISDLGLENSSARLLPAGTVCLSRTASVGFVVQMGVPMATSQDFVNWVCGPNLDPNYLRYLLMSEQETVRRVAYGTTHQTMYYPDAKALHALLPHLRQQRAIAEVLGALDDKIAANTRVALSSAEMMQSLVPTLCSDLGWAPLSQIAINPKVTISPSAMGAVAHFSLPAFDAGEVPAPDSGESIMSGKQVVAAPSVLLSRLNPRIPRVWDVPEMPDKQAVASGEFMVLEPIDMPTGLLWALLSQPSVTDRLQEMARGTSGSHQRVHPNDALSIQVPDARALSDDHKSVFASLSRKRATLRTESRRLADLRDTLLPHLMSGRLTVRQAERAASDAL